MIIFLFLQSIKMVSYITWFSGFVSTLHSINPTQSRHIMLLICCYIQFPNIFLYILYIPKYRFVRKMRLTGCSQTRNSLCTTSITTALDRVWLEAIGIVKSGRQVHTPALSHSPLHFPSCAAWLQTCSLKSGGIFSKEYPQSQFKQKHLLIKQSFIISVQVFIA